MRPLKCVRNSVFRVFLNHLDLLLVNISSDIDYWGSSLQIQKAPSLPFNPILTAYLWIIWSRDELVMMVDYMQGSCRLSSWVLVYCTLVSGCRLTGVWGLSLDQKAQWRILQAQCGSKHVPDVFDRDFYTQPHPLYNKKKKRLWRGTNFLLCYHRADLPLGRNFSPTWKNKSPSRILCHYYQRSPHA